MWDAQLPDGVVLRALGRRVGDDVAGGVPGTKKGADWAPFLLLDARAAYFAAAFFAMRLLWRAAVFLWISPLRAARSSSVTAVAWSSPA